MSSALAIAAVTATLKDLLNNGLIDYDPPLATNFSVSALPPDRITTGQTESNQINLFLYQVTPNLGWRNAGLPARDARGTPVSNPPLALDLHYLMSAYGAADLNAEVLLGYAMQLLHENPVLTRGQLRTALGSPSPVPELDPQGPFGPHSAADLAEQVEQIKITPVFLGTEELSKLWTSLQAHYRPSMAYLVSVVLIQGKAAAKAAPPVLQRGKNDRGPQAQAQPPAFLAAVRPAASPQLPAARLGDALAISGNGLRGGAGVSLVLDCGRFGLRNTLPVVASGQGLVAQLPAADAAGALAGWAIGVYQAALHHDEPGDQPDWSSNSVSLVLAPRIVLDPVTAAPGTVELALSCSPRLQPPQHAQARLLLADREIAPVQVNTPVQPDQPSLLSFVIDGLDAGSYLVRLRVDGVDSLPVLLQEAPRRFEVDPAQILTVQP